MRHLHVGEALLERLGELPKRRADVLAQVRRLVEHHARKAPLLVTVGQLERTGALACTGHSAEQDADVVAADVQGVRGAGQLTDAPDEPRGLLREPAYAP